MSPHFETLAVRIIKTSYPIFPLLGWLIANKVSRGPILQAHQQLSLLRFDPRGSPTNVFCTLVLGGRVITFYAKKSLAEALSQYFRGCAQRTWGPRTAPGLEKGSEGLEGRANWGPGMERESESSCYLSNRRSPAPPASSREKEVSTSVQQIGMHEMSCPKLWVVQRRQVADGGAGRNFFSVVLFLGVMLPLRYHPA